LQRTKKVFLGRKRKGCHPFVIRSKKTLTSPLLEKKKIDRKTTQGQEGKDFARDRPRGSHFGGRGRWLFLRKEGGKAPKGGKDGSSNAAASTFLGRKRRFLRAGYGGRYSVKRAPA